MYILIDVTVINSRSRLSTHPSLTNAITPNNSNVISPQCPRSGGLFVAQMARRRERIFFFFLDPGQILRFTGCPVSIRSNFYLKLLTTKGEGRWTREGKNLNSKGRVILGFCFSINED